MLQIKNTLGGSGSIKISNGNVHSVYGTELIKPNTFIEVNNNAYSSTLSYDKYGDDISFVWLREDRAIAVYQANTSPLGDIAQVISIDKSTHTATLISTKTVVLSATTRSSYITFSLERIDDNRALFVGRYPGSTIVRALVLKLNDDDSITVGSPITIPSGKDRPYYRVSVCKIDDTHFFTMGLNANTYKAWFGVIYVNGTSCSIVKSVENSSFDWYDYGLGAVCISIDRNHVFAAFGGGNFGRGAIIKVGSDYSLTTGTQINLSVAATGTAGEDSIYYSGTKTILFKLGSTLVRATYDGNMSFTVDGSVESAAFSHNIINDVLYGATNTALYIVNTSNWTKKSLLTFSASVDLELKTLTGEDTMLCVFSSSSVNNIILNEASPSNSRIDGVTISKISPSVKGKYYGL